MPGIRRLPVAWLLIENLMVYLMCQLQSVAVGHWLDSKDGRMSGVLQEAAEEFWRESEPPVGHAGPFEAAHEDFSKWIKYVDRKSEALKKRIREIEDHILQAGLSKNDISAYKNRKIPEGNEKGRGDGTSETPLMRIIEDDLPGMRKHLQVLKNLSAYLERGKADPYGYAQGVQEMMTEAERRVSGGGDVRRVTELLAGRLKGEPRGWGQGGGSRGCKEVGAGGSEEKMREVLRQVERKLSESFLYRNISLADVREMSRIVDFVERYRGDIRSLRVRGSAGTAPRVAP